MSNLATIVNNILADSGIDDINVVVTTGSYTNPAWIVSLPWTKITGTPTTLAGYGITDAYTQTQVNTLLNAKQNTLTLTTTGTSGAATLVGATLNIPQYQSVITNPVTGTGSAGQVAYWSSGSAITGESNLFWDATNDRLGIGTATPLFTLDVNGTGRFSSTLQATGTITAFSTTGAAAFGNGINIWTQSSTFTTGHGGILQFQNEDVITAGIRGIRDPGSWASSLLFYTHTSAIGNTFGTTFTEKARITDDGNLLVNTITNAGFKLDVNGTGRFSGNLIVTTAAQTSLSLISTETSGRTWSLHTAGTTYGSGAGSFVVRNNGADTLVFNSTGAATFISTLNVGDDITISKVTSNLRFFINNNTVTTGRSWYFNSFSNGSLYTGNTTVGDIFNFSPTGAATFSSSVTATSIIRSGGTSSQYLMADGSVSTLTNPVTGTGTTNYLPKFTGTSTIGNSQIFDNGTSVIVNGSTSSDARFIANGNSSGYAAYFSQPSIYAGYYRLIRYYTNGNVVLDIGSGNGTNLGIVNNQNDSLYFGTNGQQHFTIFGSGNVHVGLNPSSDAGFKLDVNGTGRFSGALRVNDTIYSTSSNVGTLLLGFTAGSSQIAGRITGTSSPSYNATGKIGFSVTTWGVGTDYGLTEVMAIDMRSADNKNPTIWMNPFGGSVGIGNTNPITRFTLGNYLGNRLPYINGTGNTFDAQGITVTSNNSGNTAIGGGLDLTNNIYSVGAISPVISFSSRSLNGNFNNNYAAIYGIFAGDGGEGNWSSGHLVFSTTQQYGARERVRITNVGDVGIGRTNPVSRLEVSSDSEGTAFTGITVSNWAISQARAGIAFKGYDWVQSAIWHGRGIGGNLGGALVFGTNPNTANLSVGGVVGRMWIFNSGNVGINTNDFDAGFKLDVNGTGRFSGNTTIIGNIIFNTNATTRQIWNGGYGGAVELRRSDVDTNRFSRIGIVDNPGNFLGGLTINSNTSATFSSSVTATSFFESSDARLKSNILDLDVNVSSIIAKTYLKNGIEEIGYLAQDVESILPSAISKREDGYLDLSYRQVHTAKIAYLEKRITELESQLKNK